MTENPQPRQRRFRYAIGRPAGMIILAAVLACAYLACHLLGLRRNISLLMQTSFSQGAGDMAAFIGGIVYFVLHICYVVLVPILLGAAVIMFILMCLLGRKQPHHAPPVRPQVANSKAPEAR